MQCVILAGGLGTRMRPVTEKMPKSLIPVGGKPFLFHQLAWLKEQGADEVVLCVGHLGERIRAAAPTGSPWDLSLLYVSEGDSLKGTAGALRLVFEAGLLKDRFLVLYGDSFLPITVAPIWKRFLSSSYDALMTVLRNAGQWDRSNAEFDGDRVVLYDKKPDSSAVSRLQYIDYGLSMLSRSVIDKEVPPNVPSDLAAVYHRLSVQGRLGGYEVFERFYEIGSPAGLQDLEAYLAKSSRP